jgi:glycerol-3-phosphate acyltransferase PlsY
MQLPEIFYPIFGYILGSLPIALWITFLIKGTDIRNAGSGYVTTTNTIRQAGWLPGLLVALLDFTKGYIPT